VLYVVVWALTIVMIAVFIYELVLNSQEQGSPVSFKVCYLLPELRYLTVLACCESDARTIVKRTNIRGRPFPALHEGRRCRPGRFSVSLLKRYGESAR
jgi:hypothetical protein